MPLLSLGSSSTRGCGPGAPRWTLELEDGRQSSQFAAAVALRTHCPQPRVPKLLGLCRELRRVPLAPAQPHTCSPRRAPSPSPAATPCSSGDHRAATPWLEPGSESRHLPSLRYSGGLGAGLIRGGAGPGRGGASRLAGFSRHLVAGLRQPGAGVVRGRQP
jgi:hypothetical protein